MILSATPRTSPIPPVSAALPASRSCRPSLDDIFASTGNRRTPARKRETTANRAEAIEAQVRKTRALIHNAAASREEQNAAIAELVALCGSENHAAVRLGKTVSFVQKRNFENSEAFVELRSLWPNTEPSVLRMVIAKSRSHPERFRKYLRPFLESRVGQQILRSEFLAEWERAMHDGLLPEEIVLREKIAAEEVAEMALSETDVLERELKAERDARAVLEAKVQALEAALANPAGPRQADNGAMDDAMATIVENALCGKEALTLTNLLHYVDRFLSDRVLILPSAWKSAEESDKAGFSPVEPVAEMVFKLARECVDQYRQGGHFLPGTILGSGYADSEGGGPMTKAGAKRRTFSYHGKTVPMMAHLKIGHGWNKGTTFRAHFCFDAELGKVVIGHFGKHLDR